MPIINFTDLPTDEEQERSRRFQVFKYYLENIALFVEDAYGEYPDPCLARLISFQAALPGIRAIQKSTTAPHEEVARCMGLAWASEIQLHLARGAGKALLRYSNAWAPVHAYYAIYLNLQAWFAAMGFKGLADDHTSSLRTVSNQLTTRALFPEPWSASVRGCPHLKECVYSGVPTEVDPDAHVELLSTPELSTFWPRYCKLLATTRGIRLDRNFREWMRAKGRKLTRANEKRALDQRLLPTTLFDVFWRLRIRANYRDVSTVLQSSVTDYWQEDFHRALLVLTDTTCTLLHALVGRYVGDDNLKQIVETFVSAHSGGVGDLTDFLGRRTRIVCGL